MQSFAGRSAAWRPDPVAPHRAAETNKSKLAAPDSSAPTREPERPERKNSRLQRLFYLDCRLLLATPKQRADHGLALARVEGDRRGERGGMMERFAGPIRSRRIAP